MASSARPADPTAELPDAELARRNRTVSPWELHLELFDPGSHDVWLAPEPIDQTEAERLVPAPPLVRGGLGRGVMDRAWFRRSPGAERDGPLEERTIGGLRFQRVARPDLAAQQRLGERGPRLLPVFKHHVLEFDAGREVAVLALPDGRRFVHTTGDLPDLAKLPEGWRLERVGLRAPWSVELPCPTLTIWLGAARSFQGPLGALPS